jgi:hypothetical protein
MGNVVWWNRPIEGRGEKPTTPKPTPADVITRKMVLRNEGDNHSLGGKRPTTDKPHAGTIPHATAQIPAGRKE